MCCEMQCNCNRVSLHCIAVDDLKVKASNEPLAVFSFLCLFVFFITSKEVNHADADNIEIIVLKIKFFGSH